MFLTVFYSLGKQGLAMITNAHPSTHAHPRHGEPLSTLRLPRFFLPPSHVSPLSCSPNHARLTTHNSPLSILSLALSRLLHP